MWQVLDLIAWCIQQSCEGTRTTTLALSVIDMAEGKERPDHFDLATCRAMQADEYVTATGSGRQEPVGPVVGHRPAACQSSLTARVIG